MIELFRCVLCHTWLTFFKLGASWWDLLTLVVRSWSGESESEGVKWSRMNLEVLGGEASVGETTTMADLVSGLALLL